MKMLNIVAMLGLVAFAVPAVAGEEKKSSRRVTIDKIKSGDNESIKKTAFWLITIVGSQLLARQMKWLTKAGANLLTAGGLAHLIGDMFEHDTAKTWGLNGVYLGSAFEILKNNKVVDTKKYANKAWNYANGINDKNGLEVESRESIEVGDLVQPVVLAALLKVVVENVPALVAAAQSQTSCPPCPPCQDSAAAAK